MERKNKIVAVIVLAVVCISTLFRWYVFEVDHKTNLILAGISSCVLTCTIIFFRRLYAYFDHVLPYDSGIAKRLILQILITFIFLNVLTVFILYMATHLFKIEKFDYLVRTELTKLAKITGYFTQLLVVILLNVGHFTYYSLQKWRESALRASNLEKEKSQVQFDNLKNQLNPHFLFNSLTSLDSLIQENPTLARDFLQQLSKVFRYVLKNKEKGLVSLETELAFIKNYVSLLKTRFGESLQVNFAIADDTLDLQVTPVTLQILIENAIKHNIINENNPLTIYIESKGDTLMIENNMQKKKQVETSNGQGLINLRTLYSFLSDRAIEVSAKEDVFLVKIPLI
ncbi:sensor histidine kinase [Emticicia agri]|uniref:Histidine kinase n=1 Tax=Emticicia agri TaxID=2492393 RepID=A0A4Q5LY32_9BACT|nr:histidine kinase [Emticicia agri]RYU94761.1 histidine kinase [Emticicia agri]